MVATMTAKMAGAIATGRPVPARRRLTGRNASRAASPILLIVRQRAPLARRRCGAEAQAMGGISTGTAMGLGANEAHDAALAAVPACECSKQRLSFSRFILMNEI